jgi:hypothetical protein
VKDVRSLESEAIYRSTRHNISEDVSLLKQDYTMKYTHTRQQRTPENTEMWTALVSHGVSNTTVRYFKAQWDVTVNNCLAGEDMYSRTEVTTSRMNLLHLFWEQAKSLPHPEN